MEVIDLHPDLENLYCSCLEDWSDEMKDAGSLKKEWLENKKKQGLRVKLAKVDDKIVGMIQYIPVEFSPIIGSDLYYIYCIWVHGYKQGVGNYQKKGIGTMLLQAAEEDAKLHNKKGIVAWGITLPFFMQSKWFKKHGYESIEKDGITELVWKPFSDTAISPGLLKKKKTPAPGSQKVRITCIRNGWCPSQNIIYERMKRIAQENTSDVELIEIDSENRENLEEWGMSDAIFVNEKIVKSGPPPSYRKLNKIVQKRIKSLKKNKENSRKS